MPVYHQLTMIQKHFEHFGTFALLLIMMAYPASASWDDPLGDFYPDYGKGLSIIRDGVCAVEYSEYLQDRVNATITDPSFHDFGMDSGSREILNCILENSPELIKNKMAAAAIMMGLLPSIVGTLGLRPQDTAMLALISHRRVLALLVSMGSPAVAPIRSSEYNVAIDSLRHATASRPHIFDRLDWVIIIAEYALALASVANVGHLTWELGSRATFTVLPDAEYAVLLWAFLGWVIHVMGTLTMRIRLSSKSEGPERDERKHRFWLVNFADIFTRRTGIRFYVRKESWAFAALSLLGTVCTSIHIIFGTLLFSSVLFISVEDAIPLIVRMIASAIISRIIVTYEFLVLRESVEERTTVLEQQGIELASLQ